ncbi:hypothetical protein BD626DRAFT_546366 [Schizophyllum amplum]|uniref:Amino-acid acetyltransferase, mitochondrial n=1 Tax=Schizophyllum amplum TaxID=97359 RepID=A0A550CMD8_9AGAR|nr:hypothetical protein BD626DRAFT_546366 [Auriculariopsis ampla]
MSAASTSRHFASYGPLASAARNLTRQSCLKAPYATLRGAPQPLATEDGIPPSDNDFILSILRANPSLRDSKNYLASFGPKPVPAPSKSSPQAAAGPTQDQTALTRSQKRARQLEALQASPIVQSILDPVKRRTALVKLQGPFTDTQLDSVSRGLIYLKKLGLVSVIVVENDEFVRGDHGERAAITEETMRIVRTLERLGAPARPVLGALVRLGPDPDALEEDSRIPSPEAHTRPFDLVTLRSALRAGEIPVISPLALDSFCRSVRVDANDVIGALAKGMVDAASLDRAEGSRNAAEEEGISDDVDLTPMRLMIINREGGVPSYARHGLPHLLINLESEYEYIHDTFQAPWRDTHRTALANLALARTCLAHMPPTSSAVMVSHRSPSSLIGNLITNKPAVSSSLPHALLQGNRRLTPATPTLLRRGLEIRVLREPEAIDRTKLTALLQQSFGRTLDVDAFYARLERTLDFVIVAGDYVGAAVVTREGAGDPVTYLDKFAVLPSHQGDGTVDFLWVALHDESYGLGLSFSANPNGGRGGQGEACDLVWRSRGNNPVNKWYFERSSGHTRMGDWVLFWCDAEKPLKEEESRRNGAGLSFVEDWERGRLARWKDVVIDIPSAWAK